MVDSASLPKEPNHLLRDRLHSRLSISATTFHYHKERRLNLKTIATIKFTRGCSHETEQRVNRSNNRTIENLESSNQRQSKFHICTNLITGFNKGVSMHKAKSVAV